MAKKKICRKKKFLRSQAIDALKQVRQYRAEFKLLKEKGFISKYTRLHRREKRYYYCKKCKAYHLTSKGGIPID